MKFCPNCGKDLPSSCNFCNWCGFSLNKKCSKCLINGFTKFCIECGSQMLSNHKKTNKTNNSSNEIIIIDETKSIIKDTAEKQELNDDEDVRIKVNILEGDRFREVKLDTGGGRRVVVMKKTDNYYSVFQKLKETYFPKRKNSRLGSYYDYKFEILDFKKDRLGSLGYFVNLEKYLTDNGLRASRSPVLYLHLTYIQRSALFINNQTNTNLNSNSFKRPFNSEEDSESKKFKLKESIKNESEDVIKIK